MYKPGGTLKDAVTAIERGDYVLPAIQREFVWKPEQICRLFDSIMQGIPFGTFLFWKVEPASIATYRFYGFVRDYHEQNNPHCPDLGLVSGRPLIAVLDGQQRLSALNIGLRGSMAVRQPKMFRTNPKAYPVKHLYLNLLSHPEPDEEGEVFELRFLEQSRPYVPGKELWFKVPSVLKLDIGHGTYEWVANALSVSGDALPKQDSIAAHKTLATLHSTIHSEQKISYYEETSQSLERVLRIFIRLNSDGTVLSYSDLLLSIAVAQWNGDARKEIHSLRDDLNNIGTGFAFSNDFILKAGLMLAGIASVGFKVENFTRNSMKELEEQWGGIRNALLLTVELAASFGLSGQGRWAESSLLPVAYHLYRIKAPNNFVTHSTWAQDRTGIRSWLLRSLLKPSGIWGSGLDTFLTALRTVIQSSQGVSFPVVALEREMKLRGKELAFSEPEVDFLLDVSYPDYRTFLLLSLLYPFVDLRNHFHVDHVFPKSMLTTAQLKKVNIEQQAEIDDLMVKANRLPNLQLLGGPENNEKRAKLPLEWLSKAFQTDAARNEHVHNHDLAILPMDTKEFALFFDKRRAAMKYRLKALLATVSPDVGSHQAVDAA